MNSNPYLVRKLAQRLHEDRSRRIEALLIRLASDGTLDGVGTVDRPSQAVLARNYVWCDKIGEIHDDTLNPYGYIDDGRQDYCTPDQHRAVYVQSDDPNEEF